MHIYNKDTSCLPISCTYGLKHLGGEVVVVNFHFYKQVTFNRGPVHKFSINILQMNYVIQYSQ